MKQPLNYLATRNLNSPFGKEDIFFETFIVPPDRAEDYPETEGSETIKHDFFLLDSGYDVIERYKNDTIEEKTYHIYYENPQNGKNNFFGISCRVKMGS